VTRAGTVGTRTVAVMALPSGILTADEDVVLDTRPHPVRLVPPSAVLAVALLLWVQASLAFDGFIPRAVLTVAAIVCVWWLRVFLPWWFTCFAVTSERVIVRSGVVAKHGIEIPLDRINTVFFEQSPLERLLRAGDLIIESASEQGRQVFADVARPNQVQQTIYRCKEGQADRQRSLQGAAIAQHLGAGAPAAASVTEELDRLWGLCERGAISQAEYETLKSRLLG
jgi:uncharacterized membrane protein YdbT with pleckstrin-like domain